MEGGDDVRQAEGRISGRTGGRVTLQSGKNGTWTSGSSEICEDGIPEMVGYGREASVGADFRRLDPCKGTSWLLAGLHAYSDLTVQGFRGVA